MKNAATVPLNFSSKVALQGPCSPKVATANFSDGNQTDSTFTRNVTGRHRGPERKLRYLPVRGAPGECYYNTLYYVAMCFHRRVWYRAHSLRNVCIRSSDIILIPIGYLCAKFRFFRGLHC